MSVCLIPARGGSKRIPRKNIRLFCGKPMLAWSIQAAERSGCFDSIIVSTDDFEIASVAREYGAEVPFFRPSELASDYASTQSVVKHAISWFDSNSLQFDYICCLYATAPFVQPSELSLGRDHLIASRSNTVVFSATSYPFPIQRAVRMSQNGYSSMFQSTFFGSRSQDLEEAYHDAGQFYWATPDTWLCTTNFFEGGRPLILPRWRVQDIDTEEDWIRAEMLGQLLSQQGFLQV